MCVTAPMTKAALRAIRYKNGIPECTLSEGGIGAGAIAVCLLKAMSGMFVIGCQAELHDVRREFAINRRPRAGGGERPLVYLDHAAGHAAPNPFNSYIELGKRI